VASGLSERLQNIFAKLKGKGKLTEADVNEAMREIRVAMLEADVNLAVAKSFISNVKARAIGTEVLNSLTPGQQVVKIVNEEMIALLGGEQAKLIVSPAPPTVILMAGLQGSGKTTTAGKLARLLKSQGKQPLLAAADIYRPAAIRQLQILGESQNIPVFSLGDSVSAVDIAKGAVEQAKRSGNDTVIIDTAGRLQIDEAMMDEIAAIRDAVNPTEILLVVDAMAGQEGVNVAKAFNEILALTGIVLTKLDGDTRGGVALSVKAVTGLPIKFTGTGEKIEALEPFYPDRMASRILGMGDVLSLIEKAQAAVDQEKMLEMEKRLAKNQFTLEDFADQMEQMRNMGGISEIAGMLPGMEKQLKGVQVDEKQFDRMDAIIKSMTPEERRNPSVINSSRRQRIARGSGTQVQDVNRLLKQYAQTQTMLKQMNSSGAMKRMKKNKGKGGFKFPFF